MTKFITLATAALLASSSFALAQTTSPAPAPKPSSPTTAPTTPPAAKPDSSTSTTAPSTSSTTGQARDVVLSTEQANSWVGKPVYSSDGKNLGEVAAFAREANGRVTEMHADIGGFLGIGETRVRIMPAQFSIGSDRIVLNMTSEQAKSLPHIAKK